jgi:hypothetical protein
MNGEIIQRDERDDPTNGTHSLYQIHQERKASAKNVSLDGLSGSMK